MWHFTLSPHWRPRWYVTIDGLIILSIAMNGSYSGMVPTPCTLRTWGTQAIDCSWANLMYTMPHHTPSGRTQDFDGIRRLLIVTFNNRSAVTHHKVDVLKFPLWSSSCERTDDAFVLLICFCFSHLSEPLVPVCWPLKFKIYTICISSLIATPSSCLPQKRFTKKDPGSRLYRAS